MDQFLPISSRSLLLLLVGLSSSFASGNGPPLINVVFQDWERSDTYSNTVMRAFMYPYFATISYRCYDNELKSSNGIIISDQYVLSRTFLDPFFDHVCHYNVTTGLDVGSNGTVHRAKSVIKIGELEDITLLKLDDRIEFGPRAQPIQIAKEKPKEGEKVIHYRWRKEWMRGREGIYGTNMTVMSDSNCREVMSAGLRSKYKDHMDSALCAYPDQCCPSFPLAMLINGKKELIGVGYEAQGNHRTTGVSTYIYTDVSYYRTQIADHLASTENPLKLQ